jgi:hypothetical protein
MKLTEILYADLPTRVKYRVTLTDEERTAVHRLVNTGRAAARTLTHARILLLADAAPAGPGHRDPEIVAALGTSLSTVERVRERFVEESLESALERKPRTETRLPKLDGHAEAHLVALACSPPPTGAARWTPRRLAARLVELEVVAAVSYETVRRTLKKTT